MKAPGSRRRYGFLTALALLLALLCSRPASAGEPVIEPGREAEIAALFAPHAVGDEILAGWTLHSFAVDRGTIEVFIVAQDGAFARLTLDHPDYGPSGARQLRGFSLERAAVPAGSEAAVDALVAAVEVNDDGGFWGGEVSYAEPQTMGKPLDVKGLAAQVTRLDAWLLDGVVLYMFVAGLLLALTLAKLREATRREGLAIGAIALGGAGLRVLLSPAVSLAPWSYSRELMSGGRMFHGPALAYLHPEQLWLSEVILDSTLAYACLAPLAIYVHARYLLDDRRAALLGALIVAVLPLHLRFSHSDVAFIPSITVSSTCFALLHAATRERRARWGWLALLAAGPLLALMYTVRPLNLLYYPLLLATAFVHQGLETDKPSLDRMRTCAAFVLVTAVTFGLGVPRLLEQYASDVSGGLSVTTLGAAAGVVLSPRFNALLNPVFTPPGLLALAIYGALDLWVRGRRALLAFLLAWLLGFLVAHAYVVPISPYMQARYHLHLVVPFLLLGACGVTAVLRSLTEPSRPLALAWTRGRERWVRGVGLVYLLASPLLHLHAVRHVEFNDAREWEFVHELREQIPQGCTVLEYTGRDLDARLPRVGRYSEAGEAGQLWTTVSIPMTAPGEHELSEQVRALLESAPECLYWYEGLPCYASKELERPEARACEAIEGWVELEEVASTQFESAPYDGTLADDLGEVDRVTLRLHRARVRQK